MIREAVGDVECDWADKLGAERRDQLLAHLLDLNQVI